LNYIMTRFFIIYSPNFITNIISTCVIPRCLDFEIFSNRLITQKGLTWLCKSVSQITEMQINIFSGFKYLEQGKEMYTANVTKI